MLVTRLKCAGGLADLMTRKSVNLCLDFLPSFMNSNLTTSIEYRITIFSTLTHLSYHYSVSYKVQVGGKTVP